MHRFSGTAGEKVGVRTFAYTFIPPTLVMIGVVIARLQWGLTIEELTSEPTTIAGVPPYSGAVSVIGGMGWAAAIGMFLLGAALLYERLERREAAFLAYSASLTAYLALDDAFTLHEAVLPSFGIPEKAVYAGLLLLVALYALLFRAQIRDSAWWFLALAVGLLSFSVAIDLVWELLDPSSGFAIQLLLEDGAKLFGICAWVAYAALSTRGLVRRRFTSDLAQARRPSRAGLTTSI